jgi:hypothetical protein
MITEQSSFWATHMHLRPLGCTIAYGQSDKGKASNLGTQLWVREGIDLCPHLRATV